MSHTNKRRRSGVGVALAGLLAVAGCADQQEALIVLGAPAWQAGECSVSTSVDPALLSGVLDLAYGTGYLLPVVVQNQLLAGSPRDTNAGIDNGELQIVSADVALRSAQSPALIDTLAAIDPALVEFSVDLATNSIPASTRVGVVVEVISQAASVALASAVPSVLGPNMQPVVLADVVFRARRTGNKVGSVGEIEARTYTFPIRLCTNCLYTCTACMNGQCPVDRPTRFIGGICGNAQDLLIGPEQCDDPSQ